MATRAVAVVLCATGMVVTAGAGVASGRAQAATVNLVAPKAGAVVMATVDVRATTTGTPLSVRFEWSKDDGQSWIPIATDVVSADGWAAEWETRPYSGPATVRAVVTDGVGEDEDRHRVRVHNRPLRTTVRAAPDPFSPNGDGRKDATRITVSTVVPARVRVSVVGGQGRTRRSWLVRAAPGRPARIRWLGRDRAGRVVGHGRYVIRAHARDRFGRVARDSERLFVDLRKPLFSWRRVWPQPARGRGPIRFDFIAQDRSERLRLSAVVRDRLSPIRSKHVVRRRGPGRLAFPTRYRNGQRLLPGTYTTLLWVTDEAGNVTRVSRRWRVLRNVGARVWRRMDGAGRRVALTFDDCNDAGAWTRILNTLRAYRVKASFFCPGQLVRTYPALARRTVKEGHTPGAHGWNHADLSGRSVGDVASHLRKDGRAWWSIARVTSAPYFRPPYGAYDSNTIAGAAATSHFRVMYWDVDPSDWSTSSSSYIASYVVGHARPGSIILLHVKQPTASALPRIIRGLRRKNLQPVNLDRLFRAAGYH